MSFILNGTRYLKSVIIVQFTTQIGFNVTFALIWQIPIDIKIANDYTCVGRIDLNSLSPQTTGLYWWEGIYWPVVDCAIRKACCSWLEPAKLYNHEKISTRRHVCESTMVCWSWVNGSLKHGKGGVTRCPAMMSSIGALCGTKGLPFIHSPGVCLCVSMRVWLITPYNKRQLSVAQWGRKRS